MVNQSTKRRMKKRGKVPPRFETLVTGVSFCCVRGLIVGVGYWKGVSRTYVASSVIYVPPICGSAIFAWKAEMATNMTVDMKVLKTCSTITTKR